MNNKEKLTEGALIKFIEIQRDVQIERCPEDFYALKAYNQIKEIVKEREFLLKDAESLSDLLKKKDEFIKKQLQQKPTVSREEVGTVLYVILAGIPYSAHQFRDYRDTLAKWLESKGITVIEK